MHASWSVHEAWQAIMRGYLAQPSMYAMYALRHRCHSCSSCCCPADQEEGRHYLLQRTRFLIDQVSSAVYGGFFHMMQTTLPSSCKKCSRRLMAAPYICVPSRIMLRIIACHNEKKSCSIRNPKQFVWTCTSCECQR